MQTKWKQKPRIIATLLGVLGIAITCVWAGRKDNEQAAADALFESGQVLRLRVEIPKASLTSLRNDGRKYEPAVLREGDKSYPVLVHLKGGAGSWRPFDDKPGLTVKLTQDATNSFHGLKKFHLNNSVQDESYLSEWLCSGLFRAAGVPAARAAHAIVEITGHRPDFYVIVENVNRDFLARYFKNTKGNVYSQSPNADVNQNLDRVGGQDVSQHEDLRALASAARENDIARLRERLPKVLDVERFISFMAMETMLDHWDGYTFNMKNYFVYHDLDTGRMVFIPHDMDQVVREWDRPVVPETGSLVSRAVLRVPEIRQRYLARFADLRTNVFVAPTMAAKVDARLAQLQPVLKAFDAGLASQVSNGAKQLKWRIGRRAKALEQMAANPER